MYYQIQIRRGTAAEWTATNPILAAGELAVESDTNKMKVGNGSTAWTSLAYSTITPTQLNLKADLASPTFTGNVVLPSTTSIGTVSATEIGYVDGVTSAIQTQLDSKLTTTTAVTSNRNKIINGAMNVWQRGTSISVPNNSYGFYAIDRWHLTCGAVSGNAWTVSRQPTNDTTYLPNIQYCARVQRNSGQTSVNGASLGTFIETSTAITLANKPVTLSFYARASATYSATSNALTSTIYTGTGTDQNNITGTYTGEVTTNVGYTLTTTWQRFSTTMTMPANMSEIHLRFLAPVTGTAGANDWYEITGIQLEAGAVATPFEFEDYGTTLAKCQRYYEKTYDIGTAPGTSTYNGMFTIGTVSNPTNNNIIPVRFKVEKRASPTMTAYRPADGVAGSWGYGRSGVNSSSAVTFDLLSTAGCRAYHDIGAAWTANVVEAHWAASAEL